jgi:transposase
MLRFGIVRSAACSAKLSGIDPELYLHKVLEQIADHLISRITELLPWNLCVTKA